MNGNCLNHIALRRGLIGFLLIGFVIIAARPLASAPYYYADDGFDHLFRVYALDHALHEGNLFPRTIQDLAFGYGYPIFDYYPPLVEYVAETLHLVGLSLPDAIKGTFVLAIFLALAGAYLMGAELFRTQTRNRVSGLLTAVAYVFFPYFLIDIYVRGAMPEAFAVALVPWVIWGWKRLVSRPSSARLVLAAIATAFTLLAHSLTLFIVAPCLGAFILIELWAMPSGARRRAAKPVAVAAVVSAALAATYWLPFLIELPLVRMGSDPDLLTGPFANSFLAVSAVVQATWSYQYGGGPFPLGGAAVLLGAAAFGLALFFAPAARRTMVLFLCFAVFGAVALAEPVRTLWLAVPFSLMVQYAWRLTILVGLGFSIAVGSLPVSLAGLERRLNERAAATPRATIGAASQTPTIATPRATTVARRQATTIARRQATTVAGLAVLCVVAAGVIASAVADLQPTDLYLRPDDLSIGQLARFEAYSGFVGTTTWAEYLPAGLSPSSLINYRPRGPATPPTQAHVAIEQYNATRRVLTVSTSEPISLSVRTLYLPNWHATIDGQAAPVYPGSEMRFITVDVSPGSHHVELFATDTPAGLLGNLLSIAGAIVIAAMTARMFRQRAAGRWPILAGLILVAPIFVVPAWTALAARPAPLLPVAVRVTPELELAGLRVENASLESGVWRVSEPGARLDLQPFWLASQGVPDKFFHWRLVDGSGAVRAERQLPARYGTSSTATWLPNQVIQDHVDLPLDAMPAGRYVLQVAFDSSDYATVGTVELMRPAPKDAGPATVTNRVDAILGDRIRLVGYDAPRQVQPGDTCSVTLFWTAEQPVLSDYTVFAQLLDADENVVAQPLPDTIPAGGLSSTYLWQPGKIITDRKAFHLGRDVKPGLYHWIAGMYHQPDLARLPVTSAGSSSAEDSITLGQVKIPSDLKDVRPNVMLNASLGPAIQLIGFDVATVAPGGQVKSLASGAKLELARDQDLSLDLYWHAGAKVDSDYKVFVHVTGADGSVVMQEDRLPQDGRFPTRIWDKGETIKDSYRLAFKTQGPGNYRIVVGLYSPDSGERLSVADAHGQAMPNREIEIANATVVAR